jgi:type III pantothenate kinase
MMLLDIGNTSMKWAVENNGQFTCRGHLLRRNRDFAGLANAAWGHLPVPDGIAVANVAGPALEREIDDWVTAHWQLSPCHVRVSVAAAGVVNAYSEPGKLGVDRWAALVAARHATPGPACIIDCGTAITIDALDADGRHLGGMIAPGLEMMKQALAVNTSAIDALPGAGDPDVTLLAKGTEEAINNGVTYMASAMIDRVVADLVAELGEQTETLITGGDAGRLLPLLGWNPRHDPDIVLKGVAILARNNACVT